MSWDAAHSCCSLGNTEYTSSCVSHENETTRKKQTRMHSVTCITGDATRRCARQRDLLAPKACKTGPRSGLYSSFLSCLCS